MLRITVSKSASGATKYFSEGLTKSDYYAEKGEIIGQWRGRLAERIGLHGDVKRDEFAAIAENQNPVSGEQLTARNSSSRRVGYDFTFSVPKSVSIVYAQTKDKDILRAFDEAVNTTMNEIEESAATRVRARGKNTNRNTANLLWGTFTHTDARPVGGIPDPHLHQHVFVFNATYDKKEGKIKAAQFGDIKRNASYFETVFNSRLADRLQAVGYQIERNERDFELAGFGRSTIDKFSNRTRQINDKADELGLTYEEDRAELGAKTRAGKRTGYSRDELRQQWASRLTTAEMELIRNAKSDNSSGGTWTLGKGSAIEKKKGITPDEAVTYALDHALERKSVATDKELMTLALKRSMGAATPEAIREALESRKDLLKGKDSKTEETIYTTRESVKEEQILRDKSRNGRGTFKPLNPDYEIKNEQLTAEQAGAVQHVLNSRDFITVVAGGAGTGKTWSIKEVAEGVREQGIAFGAFAPSSAASREVQRGDGFKNATTIAELLQSEKLQADVKDGVIWIDEAGMVGNQTMNRIIEVAEKQNARILLTGDIKQHGSVERGDALRIIEQFGGIKAATITKIQRQKNEVYRSAIKSISGGNLENGLQTLDEMGAIREADSFTEARENVAEEYAEALKQKENVLIVATTHKQGKAVTHTIREKLKKEGVIRGKERIYTTQQNLSLTDAEKQDPTNYQKGLVIQFHQNVKGGIKRGTKYQVLGKDENGAIRVTTPDRKEERTLPLEAASKFSVYRLAATPLAVGDQIRITQNGFSNEKKRLNNGNTLTVKGFDKKGNIIASTGRNDVTLDRHFGNLTHGYYTTSPASQGKSVNRVILMQSSMTGRAASKEQFYVSASRGKFEISIHTDDKQGLMQSVQRSAQRMTASELASQQQSQEKGIKDKLKVIGSIYRAGKSKLESVGNKWQNQKDKVISMIPKPPQPVKNAPVRTK
ncbi:MobF family relaxase [Phaeodactylibacter sp.]|uniref:MobF family relaxase n=1 Tax=Phaeodactylibacter sp. TaxID=1940289 RepID=UPI0025FC0583|nr:MobF family relaxase [Phaeodactylibacter sp.]MCI5091188.1 relaxase domain-containing protein [Phaeodactylibacter sp.]